MGVPARWLLCAMAPCAAVGVALGANHERTLAVAAAFTVAFLFIVGGRPWMVTAVGVAAVLVSPAREPVVAELGGSHLLLSDAALAAVVLNCFVRGRSRPRGAVFWLAAAMVAFGIFRASSTGTVSAFAKTIEPLVLGFVLPRVLEDREELWRWVRRWAAVVVLTMPLYGLGPRLVGLAGGPNESGLVAGALFVLALLDDRENRWRRAHLLIGVAGLVGARSITAIIAVTVVTLVLTWRPRSRQVRRVLSPAVLVVAIPVIGLAVVTARADLKVTYSVHTELARSFGSTFGRVNPLTGGGWTDSSRILEDVPGLHELATLHNTYLQWLADLGLVGLVLFGAWLLLLVAHGDRPAVAVTILAAVWLNSSGAFPGVAWGLLGIAFTASRVPRSPPVTVEEVEPLAIDAARGL